MARAAHRHSGAAIALQPITLAVAVAVMAAALAGCALAVEPGETFRMFPGVRPHVLAQRLPALRSLLLPRSRAWVSSFTFEPGVTPLSRPVAPVAAITMYFAAIVASKAYVSRRGAPLDQELRVVVAAHDVALSAWSAVLFTALSLTVAVEASRLGGIFYVYCDPRPHRLSASSPHPLVAIYYLNYLTKWYELLDTVLLALRGRPTPAMHVFHHAATLVLCYAQLADDTAVQWVPILLNLGVHVVMYAYYAAVTMAVNIRWKRRLTVAQIAQFAIDVPSCAACLALRINAERGWGWLRGANTWCRGTHRAGICGISLLAVYLCLFVDLHRRTATRKSKAV